MSAHSFEKFWNVSILLFEQNILYSVSRNINAAKFALSQSKTSQFFWSHSKRTNLTVSSHQILSEKLSGFIESDKNPLVQLSDEKLSDIGRRPINSESHRNSDVLIPSHIRQLPIGILP